MTVAVRGLRASILPPDLNWNNSLRAELLTWRSPKVLSSPTLELSFSSGLKCDSQGGVGEQASLASGAAV